MVLQRRPFAGILEFICGFSRAEHHYLLRHPLHLSPMSLSLPIKTIPVSNGCGLPVKRGHKDGKWNFCCWSFQSTCFKTHTENLSDVPKPYKKLGQITHETITHFCGPLITSLTNQVNISLVGYSWKTNQDLWQGDNLFQIYDGSPSIH